MLQSLVYMTNFIPIYNLVLEHIRAELTAVVQNQVLSQE